MTAFESEVELETVPMPKLSDFQTVASMSDDMFGWELSESEKANHLETYGFIYRCLADNRSNPKEWLSFDSAIGRNVVAAIMFGHESHLLSGIVTIFYPENGLSPNSQAQFVWMVVRHPQAHKITELRIITRSAWFISDCKSVRVIQLENQPSRQKETTFFEPEAVKYSEEQRIKICRNDPFLDKSKKGIFFNFIKQFDTT